MGPHSDGHTYGPNYLYLFKNDHQVPESRWEVFRLDTLNVYVGVTGSRNLVSDLFDMFSRILIAVTLPDSSPGCRRHSGSENDSGNTGCHPASYQKNMPAYYAGIICRHLTKEGSL